MNKQALETIAQAMVTDGKGILAADESTGTIKKADSINVDLTEDNRRDYREIFPDGRRHARAYFRCHFA